MKRRTSHSFNTFAVLGIAILFAALAPGAAHAASATLSISPDPIFEGENTTVTWSSSGTFKCVGTNFNTGGATSGTGAVKPSSTGVKTYSVLCYVSSPACSLSLQSTFTEDGPGVNTCSNITRPDGAGCYPNGAQCMTSRKKTATAWELKQYTCTGSCTTVSASDTVTVNAAPPPVELEPEITISATPSTVTEGSSTLIEWSGTGVTSCGGTNFSTNGESVGNYTHTPTGNTTYGITCNKKVFSTTPGTWQYSYTDRIDLWCPITDINKAYPFMQQCPTSNPQKQTNPRDGQSTWTNSGDPTGLSCNGSEECKVNSSNNNCVIKSEIYQCNGGSESALQKVTKSTAIVYNHKPSVPTISGATSGTTATSYSFSFLATDSDKDQLRYRIDWDNNGTVDQVLPATGYVNSNTRQSAPRSWSASGSYTLKARAQDSKGAQSSWRSHTIVVSEAKAPVSGSCSVSPASVEVNQSATWSATPSGGGGSYTYAWSGTDGLSDTAQSVVKSYSSAGTKTASVTISDGESSKAISCSNSLTVSTSSNPDPICSNGEDDDGDTLIDADDFGCNFGGTYNPDDPTESPNPQCSNGFNDDGLNGFDYPDDPFCQLSPTDDSEFMTESEEPDLLINADPTRVQPQKATVLTWSASNVKAGSCEVASNINDDSWFGASGNESTSPLQGETRYTLQCKNLSGVSVSRSIIITLAPSVVEE